MGTVIPHWCSFLFYNCTHDCTLLETNVSQTYSNLLILDLFVKFKDHSPEEIDGDIRMSGFVRNSKRFSCFGGEMAHVIFDFQKDQLIMACQIKWNGFNND